MTRKTPPSRSPKTIRTKNGQQVRVGAPIPAPPATQFEKDVRKKILVPFYIRINERLRQAEKSYNAIRDAITAIPLDPSMRGLAGAAAKAQYMRLKAYQIEQFRKTMTQRFGVTVDLKSPQVAAAMNHFINRNVHLIVTIPQRFLDGMTKDLQQLIDQGKAFDQQALKNVVATKYGSAGYNLRRITRDQTNKAIGQLNGIRQTEAGITEYVWSSSEDQRVRPQHKILNDRKFRWDKPPSEGHPGDPIQCRCVALAVIPTPKQQKQAQQQLPPKQAPAAPPPKPTVAPPPQTPTPPVQSPAQPAGLPKPRPLHDRGIKKQEKWDEKMAETIVNDLLHSTKYTHNPYSENAWHKASWNFDELPDWFNPSDAPEIDLVATSRSSIAHFSGQTRAGTQMDYITMGHSYSKIADKESQATWMHEYGHYCDSMIGRLSDALLDQDVVGKVYRGIKYASQRKNFDQALTRDVKKALLQNSKTQRDERVRRRLKINAKIDNISTTAQADGELKTLYKELKLDEKEFDKWFKEVGSPVINEDRLDFDKEKIRLLMYLQESDLENVMETLARAAYARHQLKKDYARTENDYGALSDILGGLTKNRVVGRFSHSNSYWAQGKNKVNTEVWAEMTQWIGTGKIERQMMELMMPESFALMKEAYTLLALQARR